MSKIRDAIVATPEKWQVARDDAAFRTTFSLGGESLKRPPKGYDADHPFIEDLKRKDFIASRQFSEAETCAPDFIDRFGETCRQATPFMAFLTRAVGLPW